MSLIDRTFEVHALPVGHGLALSIHCSGAFVGWPSRRQVARFWSDVMFDFGGRARLLQKGLADLPRALAPLVLSHFDADHISGVPRLLRHAGINRLWIPAIGDELRLLLSVLVATEAARLGYSIEDLQHLMRFTANPRDYLRDELGMAILVFVPPRVLAVGRMAPDASRVMTRAQSAVPRSACRSPSWGEIRCAVLPSCRCR